MKMLDEDVGGGGGPSGEDSAGWYGGGGSGNVVHQAIQMLGRSSKQFWIKSIRFCVRVRTIIVFVL